MIEKVKEFKDIRLIEGINFSDERGNLKNDEEKLLLIMNKEKKEIYYQRFSGLANSIAGKTSWYRPKV